MYNIRIKWLTVTCFEIQLDGMTVVSDPFITASPNNDLTWEAIEGCDITVLSHCHWDHITDLPVLMEKFPHSLLLTGPLTAEPMMNWLDCNPSRIYPMDSDLELDFGGVKIRALFGRHTSLGMRPSELRQRFRNNPLIVADPVMEAMQVLGTLEYRNYLITASDGTKILIWGNDPTPVQRAICRALKPDIAILQLSKQDPVEMADFAAEIGAKVVIPHHMDLSKVKEQYMPNVLKMEEEFIRRVPDGTFICPENGKWMEL